MKYQFYLLLFTIFISACSETKPTQSEDTQHELQEKIYSNERFREVAVNKISENTYNITGKAQVFEATFGWVVEDGHYELAEGFEMTDAGAPEFGNFNFTIKVQKQNPNSTLHLILFESSPEDGRRMYELPVMLE